MRRTAAMIRSFALLVTLSVVITSPAAAQLGKLRKIATDAAKDAAAAKKPQGVETPAAKVDYTVTEERADAIIAVLTPLMERAKIEKSRADAKAAYEAKTKPISACLNKVGQNGELPNLGITQSPAYEALTKRITALSQRVAALEGKSDYRGAIATQDTMLVLQMQMTAQMFGAKCGALPYKPAVIVDQEAEFMKMAKSGVAPASESEFRVPTEKRAGMTTGQFGKLRELVAIFAMQKAGDLPPGEYKFSEKELVVLNSKTPQLAPLAPYFKSGFLTWASWGDITEW
jgi:polyhydroxyalkanoate synthesis regulator phasin